MIPKINGFYIECHFIIKICWFEVGQSKFKHPVDSYAKSTSLTLQNHYKPKNFVFWTKIGVS